MAVKHRKQRRRIKRAATLGAATATVTALTVGVAPPPAQAAAVQHDLRLQAGVHIFPPPDQIPDLTGGFGTQVYNQFQTVGAQLETAFVENFNLAVLLQAAGLDPSAAINGALNDALGDALGNALSGLPIDVSELLGIDLEDPLSSVGINVITTGGVFTLLRLLGVDLGWVPSFPNSVADEINNTEYLEISLESIFEAVGLPTSGLAFDALKATIKTLTGIELPPLSTNAADVRIPIVAGWGFGAFAAGAAYQQVVDDLPNQPGGAAYTGTNPLLGSYTILPMILIDNPGRANGGILARAYPLFGLLGIDTVTPDTQVQSSGTSILEGIPVVEDIPLFGLTPGGANLIPIKIDATAEYLPLSDFAAWPNPFTMANNVAAGLFPTYILRNQSLDTLTTVLVDQIVSQLGADITDYLADPGDDPQLGPKLNIYVTIPANSLPLLEPTYLAVDVINLLTGANFNNPIGTALTPVLTSLVNLGYTDVYYDEQTGIYDRTLDEADIPTAFGTLPADVDWGQVPGHLANNLVTGIQKAISDGLINQNPVPSPIQQLLGLLGVGNTLTTGGPGLDLSSLTDALNAAGTQSNATTSFEPQAITQTNVGTDTVNLKSVVDEPFGDDDGAKKLTAAADDARQEVEKTVKDAGERAKVSAEKARERTAKAVKDAQDRVNKLAEDGRKQIKSAAEGIQKGAQKAVNDVKDNVKKAGDSVKPAKKAEKKDAA
ncbi:AAA family ATPase [Mycolicibacterium neworleansense]|uniref:ATPase n=1 Tax=Mycolicibacterium neworleansense TaxID=146018 RepID=A0A0H5RSD6_9MYCO|nr:AAA family ATPase [Mycolicibacterium neworleansense]MCV7363183.1 AAA family ATPase [Mycolicibacterium neworleansense]CRZ17080.1 ATPase [Mycolicibacterium neworleansense]